MRVAGVPEVVDDGATGFVVAPGDLSALTARVGALLDDDGRRLEMGAAAERRCRSLFDIGVVAEEYVKIYRSVARTPAP